MRLARLVLCAGLSFALPAQTTEVRLTNPLAPKAGTAGSLPYINLRQIEGGGTRPVAQASATFGKEASARQNQYDRVQRQYDRVRNQYDIPTKASAYDHSWLRQGIVRTNNPNYDAPSHPLGYQRLDLSGKGAAGAAKPGAEAFSAAAFEARFPNAPLDRGPNDPARRAVERPVAGAREPSSSPPMRERNLARYERDIRATEARIGRIQRWGSDREVGRRQQEMTRRFDRRVRERLLELRRAGQLEHLAKDARGHLVNARTGKAAGVGDLPKADRQRLQRDLDGARKRAAEALKGSKKLVDRLQRQKAKLEKKQAREAKRPKPVKTTKGGK